jgi:hypothetical protein
MVESSKFITIIFIFHSQKSVLRVFIYFFFTVYYINDNEPASHFKIISLSANAWRQSRLTGFCPFEEFYQNLTVQTKAGMVIKNTAERVVIYALVFVLLTCKAPERNECWQTLKAKSDQFPTESVFYVGCCSPLTLSRRITIVQVIQQHSVRLLPPSSPPPFTLDMEHRPLPELQMTCCVLSDDDVITTGWHNVSWY